MTFDGRVEAQMTVPSGTVMTCTNNGGTSIAVTVPTNTYFLSALVTQLQTSLNNTVGLGAGWAVTLSTGASGTGQVTINDTGQGVWTLIWTSTTLRDILGFTANINTAGDGSAQTGAKQARGLWIPDCPLACDGDPRRAPKVTDLRTTQSPTFQVLGLIGNWGYRQTRLTWSHVAQARTWEQATTLANASWETFFNETQLGLSSSWFTPASPVQIYAHTGLLVGLDANGGAGMTAGWCITGLSSIEPQRVDPSWTGMWRVELPQIVSPG